MGSQQLAVDGRGRPVLVKAAPAGPAAERLRREAAALRAAAHPGVVELLAFEEDEGGVRLRLLVAGTRTFADLGDDLVVGLEALAALAATVGDLHHLGLVHGRVQAEHVVLDGGGRPVLCGFADAATADEADPAVDVAGLGELLVGLLRRAPGGHGDWEPIPDRRFGRAARWDGFTRRGLLTLADQATADDPRMRPTARAFAAALLASLPASPPARRRWRREAGGAEQRPASPDRPPAGWRDFVRPPVPPIRRDLAPPAPGGTGGEAREPPQPVPRDLAPGGVGAAGPPTPPSAPPDDDPAGRAASGLDELAARRLEAARLRHPSWKPGRPAGGRRKAIGPALVLPGRADGRSGAPAGPSLGGPPGASVVGAGGSPAGKADASGGAAGTSFDGATGSLLDDAADASLGGGADPSFTGVADAPLRGLDVTSPDGAADASLGGVGGTSRAGLADASPTETAEGSVGSAPGWRRRTAGSAERFAARRRSGRRARSVAAPIADAPLDAVAMLEAAGGGGATRGRPGIEVGRIATGVAGAVGLGLLVFGAGALLRPTDVPEVAAPAAPAPPTASSSPADDETGCGVGGTEGAGAACGEDGSATCGLPPPASGSALVGSPTPTPAGDAALPPSCPAAAGAPPGCPPAAEPAADPDGDGCPSTATVGDAVVEVDGVRYGVGRSGDLLVLGDWDCDGAATVAVVRPGSGEVFVFDGWAGVAAARTAPSSGSVPGARAAERREEPGGCDALVVVDDAGRRTEVPA